MFKATLTTVLLSSVALVPAATIAVVATADAAHAKSENAGGKGGNKGGKSLNAKSKSDAKRGGGKTKTRRSGKDPVGKFLRKVTGQEKRASRTAKIKDPMHPSNLGKMNGPLNANVNALIAHVKNGNTNGPIGGMAALAVAGYAAEGAAETIALNEQFEMLDTLLVDNGYVDAEGNADLQSYLDALEDGEPMGEIEAIEEALSSMDSPYSLEEALLEENNGERDFASIEEYETWRDGVAPIEGADTLITDLEGQERPSEEDLEYAGERLADQTAAEDYMLSIWNKGDGDDTMRSGEEELLLEALYERIETDGDTLDAAIEEYADLPEPPMEGEIATCELEEGCEEGEEMVVAAE